MTQAIWLWTFITYLDHKQVKKTDDPKGRSKEITRNTNYVKFKKITAERTQSNINVVEKLHFNCMAD